MTGAQPASHRSRGSSAPAAGCPTGHSLCHGSPHSHQPPSTHPGARRGNVLFVVASKARTRCQCPGDQAGASSLESGCAPSSLGMCWASAPASHQEVVPGPSAVTLPPLSPAPTRSGSQGLLAAALDPSRWHSSSSQPRGSPGSETRTGQGPRGRAGEPCPRTGGGLGERGREGSRIAGTAFGAVLWP